MLEYCLCPKCGRMIMLDGDLPDGFCLYCGTHIAYDEAREELVKGLRAAIPDEFVLEADLSELIDEDDAGGNAYGLSECREECAKGQERLGKWDFGAAFEKFSRALEWYPQDIESACGRLTAGILRLTDVQNWEGFLDACTAQIRSQSDWNMAQKSLEYAMDILRRFLSKGGRYVSPDYTVGFFEKLAAKFPQLKITAAEIFAHCLNIENAPLTDAARMDHETSRFAVGDHPAAPEKEMRRGMLFVMKCHPNERVKESLCRALYVYDRGIWLRSRDEAHINDAISLCAEIAGGDYPPQDVRIVLSAMYDLLMMGGIEQNTTDTEKIMFLSRVYTYGQMKQMERFFSGKLFFNKLYAEIYLSTKGASPLSAEYRRIQEKIAKLS